MGCKQSIFSNNSAKTNSIKLACLISNWRVDRSNIRMQTTRRCSQRQFQSLLLPYLLIIQQLFGRIRWWNIPQKLWSSSCTFWTNSTTNILERTSQKNYIINWTYRTESQIKNITYEQSTGKINWSSSIGHGFIFNQKKYHLAINSS